MRRIALASCLFVGACTDVDFVEGVRCKNSEECGRTLDCEQGFCGGCSEEGLLANGKCGCPGDRIFDCRVLDPAPYCMPVCPSQHDRCAVALVMGGITQTIAACATLDDGATDPCFSVEAGGDVCPAGNSEIRVTAPDLAFEGIVANCPPIDDERFDCPP